jgi:hypothetical protein
MKTTVFQGVNSMIKTLIRTEVRVTFWMTKMEHIEKNRDHTYKDPSLCTKKDHCGQSKSN